MDRRIKITLRSLALIGLFAWASSPLLADECLDCHDTNAGVHEILGCEDCHSNVSEIPHQDDVLGELSGNELCSQCHSAGEYLLESVHVDHSCSDCHEPAHEVLPVQDLNSRASTVRQVETCGQCHGDGNLSEAFVASAHGRAIFVAGLVSAPSCNGCHGSHSIFALDNDRSTVGPWNIPETCGRCHSLLLDRWRESAHGEAWSLQGGEGPVCNTCHDPHSSSRPYADDERTHQPEVCGECHADALESYRESFHGKVTHLGLAAAAVCSDCHTPHLNLATADPRSSTHADNIADTCRSCHEGATDAFVGFAPHTLPHSEDAHPAVRMIYFFMTSLLFGVFGFFTIHALLWLQRSLVGVIRGEFKEHRESDEQWVRRFKSSHIRTHIAVVVTFLLLAATGLPLRFHGADWAQVLIGFFGGAAQARSLHRFAAILTFGYALYHVGYLVRKILIDKQYHLLWGWASLVPNPKDFADFFAYLKYFLYMGERPKFDRFTYWEKFDYFAVFWGVPIIGGSGLVLWYSEAFAKILPGWALNAAYLIHADEALLATGFIFFFHFFHTHLRPESFPIDPVIFVGKMPLRRFKDERPMEYQRLVESGELEEHLELPPTRRQMRRALAFGFLALFIGLALAVGIAAGFLIH